MLRAARLDILELEEVAERVKWLLILLWATGLPLVGLIFDWDFSLLATKPKLLTKIIVVLALTLNGVVIHAAVLPMLRSRSVNSRYSAVVSCVVGAVSTVSWLYASFVGVARLIAPKLSLIEFVGLYAILLAGGLAFALLILRRRMECLIANDPPPGLVPSVSLYQGAMSEAHRALASATARPQRSEESPRGI